LLLFKKKKLRLDFSRENKYNSNSANFYVDHVELYDGDNLFFLKNHFVN
jgi:hypothetical protein